MRGNPVSRKQVFAIDLTPHCAERSIYGVGGQVICAVPVTMPHPPPQALIARQVAPESGTTG